MSKSIKKAAYRYGNIAEWIAVIFLFLKGYRIIERNFCCKAGEIDIIAMHKNLFIAIEVKARRNTSVYEVLTLHQTKRISKATILFIAKRQEFATLNIRFDLIVIYPWKLPFHIKNAWQV